MKHIRPILATAILLMLCTCAHAQFVRFSIGAEGGGYGSILNNGGFNFKSYSYGGYGGGDIEVRFGRVLGIDFKAMYSYQVCNYAFMNETLADYIGNHFKNNQPGSIREYVHLPVALQLWMGEGAVFEVGYQYSILLKARYNTEDITFNNEDQYACKNYGSIIAGFKFNMGRVVYLNIRVAYGLDPSFNYQNTPGLEELSATVGLGFRLYSYRKSAFK